MKTTIIVISTLILLFNVFTTGGLYQQWKTERMGNDMIKALITGFILAFFIFLYAKIQSAFKYIAFYYKLYVKHKMALNHGQKQYTKSRIEFLKNKSNQSFMDRYFIYCAEKVLSNQLKTA